MKRHAKKQILYKIELYNCNSNLSKSQKKYKTILKKLALLTIKTTNKN